MDVHILILHKAMTTLQVTWPNRWSSLVEWLKNPGVDDTPTGFITSNEGDRLRHPVRLNVGKRPRKGGQLRSLWFFSVSIFVSHFFPPSFPHPITIAGSSNSRYCVFVRHFSEFKNKCCTKTQYREFQGPAIAMGEIEGQKSNHSRKNWKRRFDFFGCDFRHSALPTHPAHLITVIGTFEFGLLSLRQTFLRIYPSQSQNPQRCNIAN